MINTCRYVLKLNDEGTFPPHPGGGGAGVGVQWGHRRARWVLPYQARFKTCSCLISNPSKNQEFIQTTSQFQARSENLKSKNLNFKQDLII